MIDFAKIDNVDKQLAKSTFFENDTILASFFDFSLFKGEKEKIGRF